MILSFKNMPYPGDTRLLLDNVRFSYSRIAISRRVQLHVGKLTPRSRDVVEPNNLPVLFHYVPLCSSWLSEPQLTTSRVSWLARVSCKTAVHTLLYNFQHLHRRRRLCFHICFRVCVCLSVINIIKNWNEQTKTERKQTYKNNNKTNLVDLFSQYFQNILGMVLSWTQDLVLSFWAALTGLFHAPKRRRGGRLSSQSAENNIFLLLFQNWNPNGFTWVKYYFNKVIFGRRKMSRLCLI